MYHEINEKYIIDHAYIFPSRDLLPNATLPPHIDHEYAQWQDRDISLTTAGPDTPLKNENSYVDDSPSKIEEIGLVLWGSLSRRQFDDMRQCLFCGKYGDDSANVSSSAD